MNSFEEFYNIYKTASKKNEHTYNDFLKRKTKVSDDKISPIKNNRCLIVIPAYNNRISDFETRNFKNNVEKLYKDFDICIVCPTHLKKDIYNNIIPEANIQYLHLPSRNFSGKNSYSDMMLSPQFYENFKQWKYILILQLDAYIFGTANELNHFIDLGKTYIGAPWTLDYSRRLGIPEETCGNGGLSLRNVERMISLLKLKDTKRNERLKTVEDQYISYMLYNLKESTDIETALNFSIDNDTEYWHRRLGKLPWGIHMGKQEFVDYWNIVTNMNFLSKSNISNKQVSYNFSSINPDINQKLEIKEPIIVSLTSFGERLKNDAPNVIKEILTQQTLKPTRIVLSLFKEDINNIPNSIMKLKQEGKVEILISEINFRPHLKYYPTMLKYKDAIIVTIDDDQHYYSKMIEDLYKTHIKYPNAVCACRCHKITYNQDGHPKKYNEWIQQCRDKSKPSYDLFATGVGGVLYPPNILQVENIKTDDIFDYITTDDILLKILENELNVAVVGTPNYKQMHSYLTKSAKTSRLCDVNTTGMKINDINIAKGRLLKKEDTNIKICYTCITGKYDKLIEPQVVTPGWKYICFTDQEIRPLPDEIKNDESLSVVKKQRIIKIQPYRFLEPYNVCLWVDGNLTIKSDLNEFINRIPDDDIVTTKHPKRDCIYDEAKAILGYKKDTKENLDRQLGFYISEKFPQHFGLCETNVIVRKNTNKVRKIMDLWATILKEYSHRDQMSLNYVLWKLNAKISNFTIQTREICFQVNRHQRQH